MVSRYRGIESVSSFDEPMNSVQLPIVQWNTQNLEILKPTQSVLKGFWMRRRMPTEPQGVHLVRNIHVICSPNDLTFVGIVINDLLIIQLCAALLVWLNLKASVSRDTANTILKALQFILNTALQLLEAALGAQGIAVQLPKIQIPIDLQTIYRNYTKEPDIIRAPCCPKCYTLYPSLAKMPERCTAKVSKNPCLNAKQNSGGHSVSEKSLNRFQ
jgi:hypothetical protein